ncbi:hypothetical protein C8R46DRAFT_643456 [Mycena filopes]|nr:hypothetical protein C8R46DRAFT_643456 [Mycena filopes]
MKLFITLLATAAAPALAANIAAFTNFNCGGTETVVVCDGSCHSFTGKNSFIVDAGAEHCVSVYTGTACESSTFQFPNPNQDGSCTNLETSQPILSFSCSADNTCAT